MARFGFGRATKLVAVLALAAAPALVLVSATAAGATTTSESALRSAFESSTTSIDLGSNITITNTGCTDSAWLRTSSNPLTIDGHGFTVTQTCPDVGIFHSSDSSAALTFQNITLTGGTSSDNGGAIDSAGPVTVINSTITNNVGGEDGGGIWGANGVTVQGSTITSNTAGSGGGISALRHVWVTNSTIANNRATGSGDGGGGIASASAFDGGSVGTAISNDGGVTVTGSSITNNTAVTEGGGFVSYVAEITDSTIAGNQVSGVQGEGGFVKGDGGGFDTGPAIVTRSTISGNGAPLDGGGFEASGDTTVTNSTITNNSAGNLGGGINMWEGNLTLAYDTITKNSAQGQAEADAAAASAPEPGAKGAAPSAPETGEGAHTRAFNGQAANVQLAGDCTDCGGILTSFGTVIAQPLGGGVPNCMVVSTASQGYNFSDDGSGNSCGFDGSTDTHIASNNPTLGDLADNGGPTMTRLPLPGSPLIDAILTSACQNGAGSGVTTDQRGVSRPQIHGCDIGAVEVKGASLDVTKVVTGNKGVAVPAGAYSFKVTCSDGTTGTLTVADATLGGTSGTVGNILPGATCSVVEAPVVYTNLLVTAQPVVTYSPTTTAALAEAETATITVTNDYSLVNLLGETVVRPPLVLQPRFTG